MPIKGKGWEMLIERTGCQYLGNRERTIGTYKVYHNGKETKLSGATAESPWPGDNERMGCGMCIESGTYPLATQDGERYKTIGYVANGATLLDYPQPGIELLKTGNRKEILIHPGAGFLKSVGCINLTNPLEKDNEKMDWPSSRWRVIAVIEDLKKFLGKKWPGKNGKPLPNSFVVIEEKK